jgi:hypothetical protein
VLSVENERKKKDVTKANIDMVKEEKTQRNQRKREREKISCDHVIQ